MSGPHDSVIRCGILKGKTMILSILTIVICAFVAIMLIGILHRASKLGIPVGKPLLYGICSMGAGYTVSALILAAVNAIMGNKADALFENPNSYVIFGAATGAAIAVAMFVVFILPMKKQRSAMEVLIYGVGVSLPLLIYRVLSIIISNIECIKIGAGYDVTLTVFAMSIIAMFTSFLEVFCAIIMASLINRNKKLIGLLTVVVIEIVTYGASSFSESFGWPDYVYYIVMSIACVGTFMYVIKVWRDFPPTIVEKKKPKTKNIQWPDERWDDDIVTEADVENAANDGTSDSENTEE